MEDLADGSWMFLLKAFLSELTAWDAVQGAELAQRAVGNNMRYHKLFCKVIDSV